MTSDNSKPESLVKILRQEKARGYSDSVVIGGLDRFLQRWTDDLKPLLGEPGSYSLLTSYQRASWAEKVLASLSGAVGSNEEAGPPPRKSTVARAAKRPAQVLSPRDPASRLKGVSTQNMSRLKHLGVESVQDLIYLFPHRHNDFASICKVSELEPGKDQTVVVTVWEAMETGAGPRRRSSQAIVGDDTGNVRAIWFNNPYMARSLRSGTELALSGRVNVFRGQFVFESPEYELLRGQEELVHTGRLVPVYPSTERLPQRTLRRIVKQALDLCLTQVADFVPEEIRHRIGIMGLQNAIAQMHYPDSSADWKAARRRLAFDELLLLQLALIAHKRQWQVEGTGVPLNGAVAPLDDFLGSLPFSLTGAQTRVLHEILVDLEADKPMSRLLQGEVGSGKTLVAAATLLVATFNGYQAALMAPTEVLAEQHFVTLGHLLSGLPETVRDENILSARIGTHPTPVTLGLLLGSLSRPAKNELHQRIGDGEIDIVIGTQALIQSSVEIPRLAVVVVDEQHRFGVTQRASLREKGQRPHLLGMSATPIPRSLALTVYGDLDISIIDELPPGRQRTRTRWVDPAKREAAYGFVRKEVEAGRQAFIVCPLVEESEAIQSRAAIDEHQRLSSEVFPDLKLGLIHGRMALSEKEQVMEQFRRGEVEVLVASPVVEVGIDVPNATVMLIDGADRFGLAQLHQFRGRVGRGQHQSHCLLLADSPGEEARERLRTVERIQDGFQLAEEDLRLRGPGDRLGTRQSGLPDMRVARLTDQDILILARREATRTLDMDPDLSREEHAGLRARLDLLGAGLSGEIS